MENRYFIYKYLHLVGFMLTFFAYGMLIYKDKIEKAKGIAVAHGIGLFMLLLGGGGMMAVLKVGQPNWMVIKMVLFVLLGLMIVWVKRKPNQKMMSAFILSAIGAAAAFFGVFKPMF